MQHKDYHNHATLSNNVFDNECVMIHMLNWYENNYPYISTRAADGLLSAVLGKIRDPFY